MTEIAMTTENPIHRSIIMDKAKELSREAVAKAKSIQLKASKDEDKEGRSVEKSKSKNEQGGQKTNQTPDYIMMDVPFPPEQVPQEQSFITVEDDENKNVEESEEEDEESGSINQSQSQSGEESPDVTIEVDEDNESKSHVEHEENAKEAEEDQDIHNVRDLKCPDKEEGDGKIVNKVNKRKTASI